MQKTRLEDAVRDIIESDFREKQIIVWYDEGETLKTAIKRAIPDYAKAIFFEGSYLKVRAIVEQQDREFKHKWFIYVGDQPRERSWLKDYELFGVRHELTLARILASSFGLKSNTRVRELLSGKGGRLLTENWSRFIDATDVPLTAKSVIEGLLAAIFGMLHGFDIKTAVLTYLSDPKYARELAEYDIYPEFWRKISHEIWGSERISSVQNQTQDREHLAATVLLTEFVERSNGFCENEFAQLIPKKERRSTLVALVDEWTQYGPFADAFFEWASLVQAKYGIEDRIQNEPSIARSVSFEAIDTALLRQLVTRINREGIEKTVPLMEQIAPVRSQTIWARSKKVAFWDAISVAASLMRRIKDAQKQIANERLSADDLIRRYTDDDGWWELDDMSISLTALGPSGGPEMQHAILEPATQYYGKWLSNLGTRFSEDVVQSKMWTSHTIGPQRTFFNEAAVSKNERVAILLIDALRYDLAKRLAAKLSDKGYEVTTRNVLSSLPSTTEVGMGALLPYHNNNFLLDVKDSKIKVAIGANEITTRTQRKEWITRCFPSAVFFDINEITRKTPRQLHDTIENAFQLFVLDHEVDQMGTFNTTDVSASVFLSLVDRIAKAVESLHQAGVSKVVIGTDHGFLVLPRELRGDAPIKGIPGNQDTFKSWRFVIGKPPGDPTLISFSYEDLGLGSGGIARFPRSTHIFALRGTQDFFHGGISLQENCLLCITSVSKLEDLELVKVHVEVPEQLNPQDIPITLKPEHNVTRSPRSVIVEVLEGEKVLYQTPEHKIFVEPVHVHIALQETPQNLRIKVYDVDTYEVLFSETRDTISRGFDDFL